MVIVLLARGSAPGVAALSLPGKAARATALRAGAGSPRRGLPFPRMGHSTNIAVTGSGRSAPQRSRGRLQPSDWGHQASGELASRRRDRLGIRGCRSHSGPDPSEARAAAPAPPAAPGAGTERRGGAAGWPGARAAQKPARPERGEGEGLQAEPAARGRDPSRGGTGTRGAQRRAALSWSGRAPAPRGRGSRTRWKRGWTITGTSPSLTLLGKPAGKRRTPGRPGRGAERDRG